VAAEDEEEEDEDETSSRRSGMEGGEEGGEAVRGRGTLEEAWRGEEEKGMDGGRGKGRWKMPSDGKIGLGLLFAAVHDTAATCVRSAAGLPSPLRPLPRRGAAAADTAL